MTHSPATPAEFFAQLPEHFAPLKSALGRRSSPGSMTFHVAGEAGGTWSLRLDEGELRVAEAQADDVIMQVSVSQADFQHLMIQSLALAPAALGNPQTQLLAFKALTIDAERVRTVRAVKGSVAFIINDGLVKRKIVLTPGAATPNVDQPECRLECQSADFLDMQLGKAQPLQLVMTGKMRMVGDPMIAMALNAVLS